MFISRTLGTVIGDFCSHNMGLDDAGTSILLPPIVAVLFLAGRGGAASFAAVLLADRCFDQSRSNGGRGFHLRAQHAWPARDHCGHGALFVALQVIWREQSRSEREREIAIAS
jgi:hypothetical protein